MKKLRNIMMVMVLAIFASACTEKAEDPSINGEWIVENVFANGELNIPQVFDVDAVLHLDSNETFLFVNIDGRASGGTWTSDGTDLVLTGSDSYAQNFTIVFFDWEKLHIVRTLSVAQGADVELRYLFRRR